MGVGRIKERKASNLSITINTSVLFHKLAFLFAMVVRAVAADRLSRSQ